MGYTDGGSETYIDELGRRVAVGHGLRHSERLIWRSVSLEKVNVLVSYEQIDTVGGGK